MVIKSLIGSDFVRQAKIHGDKTSGGDGETLGWEISDSLRDSFASRTSSRALKKIGLTRKKRPTAIASEMKSSGRLF